MKKSTVAAERATYWMSAGAGRSFAVEPGELVGDRVRVVEHRARPSPELERPALVRDRKPSDRDAVDLLDPGRQLVAPGDVVARTGRDHLDLGVPGEMFSDVARVQLRSAVDVGAVALNDDRELHDSFGSPTPRSAGPALSAGSNPPPSSGMARPLGASAPATSGPR